jgi:hypothetical protein
MNRFFVGLDLGQRQDHTAVAVVERMEQARAQVDWIDYATRTRGMRTVYGLRHLERMKLGTPYTRVVARVREMVRSPALAGNVTVVADATGVGGPVIEMLREAGLGCEIAAVTITGGLAESRDRGVWRVPKRDLVTCLQAMLDDGQLQFAAGLRELGALVEELRGMRMKISAEGRDSYGAWREGTHDDLVLAVALACWRARSRGKVGERSEPLVLF